MVSTSHAWPGLSCPEDRTTLFLAAQKLQDCVCRWVLEGDDKGYEGFRSHGVALNHPFLDGIFPDKPSILGTPIYGTPQMFLMDIACDWCY